jgi:hypothetical protein
MKAEKVEELYEHFDVDFYEKARTMVPTLRLLTVTYLTLYSTHNGQDIAIREAYHSTFTSSSILTARMCPSIRKSLKHTRRAYRIIRARARLLSCSLYLRFITTSSTLYSLCALPSSDLILKYRLQTPQISSISPTSA